MKIQNRIVILFAGLAASLVLTLSILVYYFANQNTFEDFYKRLEIRAIIAAKAAIEKDHNNIEAYNEIRQKHLEQLPFEKEYLIQGDTLANFRKYANLRLPEEYYERILRNNSARHRIGSTFFQGLKYEDNGHDHIVLISARNEFIGSFLLNLRKILLISILATVLLSFLVGIWFSGLILRPIRAINSQVQNIGAYNLHLRLEKDDSTDEISELSETFNNMLDRLETSFETQNNFISNASHELNTPLTAIMGEAEYILSKPRKEEQYVNSLSVIQIEAERLYNITKSLLHLAQTGFNGKTQQFVKIRIDELMYTVKATVANIIPDSKVFINHSLMPEDEKKLIVNGNQQLLELAFANVVLNGVKYSSNQPVQIVLAATNEKAIILIKDMGIGIPKEEIKHVFDPFFRASNTLEFKGYGIGLPLSRNIVRIHHGDLVVYSEENKGAEIKIILPLASED